MSCRLPPGSRRWRSERADETGIGAQPARRASWASVLKRWMPAISPMNLAASRTPAALGEQLRSGLGDQLGELVMQSGGGAGELADAADHVARDEDPDRGFGAVKAPGDLDLPGRMHQRLCRDLPFRPQTRSKSSSRRPHSNS